MPDAVFAPLAGLLVIIGGCAGVCVLLGILSCAIDGHCHRATNRALRRAAVAGTRHAQPEPKIRAAYVIEADRVADLNANLDRASTGARRTC
jgi:hypothetical protein